MVKKSTNKSIITSTLGAQKRTVKRAALDYLGAALLFLLICIVALIVGLTLDDGAHARSILCGALPILSVFFTAFAFFAVKRFLILGTLSRVRTESGETVNVDCQRVRFITHARTRSSFDVIAIILIDTNRQKYIYVLPHSVDECKSTRADVSDKCVGKTVEAVCYTGTRIIKDCGVIDLPNRN